MKRHTVWLRGVLTAWGIGALALSIGVGEAPAAEETHQVEHKPKPVDKNDKIDKNDEEIVKPETMTIVERIITVTSKTFLPPKNEPPNKEWKFKSFGTTHVDIHDLPPDGLTRRVVPPAATNDTTTRIKVEAVGLEANAALWPLRCEGNLEPPKGKGKPKKWHWSAKAGRIKIEYIGGTHPTDATKEDYKSLGDEYVMRGYMLKITCPKVKTGTDVTWTIKKGETEVGTYHQAGAWANYKTALPTKPKSQTIYWRSPYTGGTIDDAYTISASFTTPEGKPVTLTREIRSRKLDWENADHRDKFNEDTDMVQRAMIQVLYLDKGRLDSYRIGKYDRNAQGFYHSSCEWREVRNWSPIADEVWNFDKFALNATLSTSQLSGSCLPMKSVGGRTHGLHRHRFGSVA